MNRMSGDAFCRAVIDQFDQLYEDGAQSGGVMALGLHPFVVGQPSRHHYLEKAMDHIVKHEGVCLTSEDIASHYLTAATPESRVVAA
jgi:allantoinase